MVSRLVEKERFHKEISPLDFRYFLLALKNRGANWYIRVTASAFFLQSEQTIYRVNLANPMK